LFSSQKHLLWCAIGAGFHHGDHSFLEGDKATKRKTKRKATKRKATKRKATKRKATKRKATKRKAVRKKKKKAAKRKATKRKATKRKAKKKKATKRKVTKKKKATKRKKKAAKKKAKKKTKRKPNPAFMRPLQPDAALSEVVGSNPLPRTEVTKKLWVYIRKNGLQDSVNRRMINADAALKVVFNGKPQVSMFEMTKLVARHLK
jgi:chromatin remodeling complex protein RSC6